MVNLLKKWWPGTELNRRRQPFQGCALPPELPGHSLLTALAGLWGHARIIAEMPAHGIAPAGKAEMIIAKSRDC